MEAYTPLRRVWGQGLIPGAANGKMAMLRARAEGQPAPGPPTGGVGMLDLASWELSNRSRHWLEALLAHGRTLNA